MEVTVAGIVIVERMVELNAFSPIVWSEEGDSNMTCAREPHD